jgi:hypothetical protein
LSHFGFRVVSGRVGLGIESSSVGSFRVSSHIRSGRVGYQIVQYRVISGYRSYWIWTGRTGFSGWVGFCHLYMYLTRYLNIVRDLYIRPDRLDPMINMSRSEREHVESRRQI